VRLLAKFSLAIIATNLLQSVEPALAATPVVGAGQSFKCTPVAVYDGDGPIWCAEGPHIRLSGIAAREMDGTCRSNQPCPSATATEARDALVRLLGGPRGTLSTGHIVVRGPVLTCQSLGSAGGTRTAAWCASPQRGDVSCRMLATGTVLKWAQFWGNHVC
jgi:endonuclease YncB( thermonuclease family)